MSPWLRRYLASSGGGDQRGDALLELRCHAVCVPVDVALHECAVADKAHEVCPNSNATRGNIEVVLNVSTS